MAETSAQDSVQADKGKKYLGKYCVAGGPNGASCKNNSSTVGISMHEFPKKVGSSLHFNAIAIIGNLRHTPVCALPILTNLEDTNTAKTKRLLDRSLAIPTIDTVSSERTSDAVSSRGRMQVREYQCVNNYIQCLL